MSTSNVRKGNTQSSFNEGAANAVIVEIILLSSALGYSFGKLMELSFG